MNPVQDRSKFQEILKIFRAISQLNLFDKEQALDDPHYHHKGKCQLVSRKTPDRYHPVKYQYCKTHQVNVCSCGWEIGYHYGKKSEWKEPTIKNQKYCHCGRRVWARDLCRTHLAQWYRSKNVK